MKKSLYNKLFFIKIRYNLNMKNKIKLISIITILVNLLFNSVIFADDTVYTEGTLKYKINDDGTVTIIDYFGVDKEVKVPMNMGMYIVTEIGPGAFANSDIEKIEIPNTVTTISEDSFKNIDSIEIESFNMNDEIIDNEIKIVYTEKKDQNKEETTENEEESKNETINEEPFTTIDISEDQIPDEEITNINKEENQEHSSEVTVEAKEKDDLNPGVFTKTMSVTTGGYLLIVAIILVILIGIVLIIRKKKNKNK